MSDRRAVFWVGVLETYGDPEHHADQFWTCVSSFDELNALRIVKQIGGLIERGADVVEGERVLGVSPELLVLRARRWLGWLEADRARQREACVLLGVEFPVSVEAMRASAVKSRRLLWRWPWEPAGGCDSREPVVVPSTGTEPARVEWPVVRVVEPFVLPAPKPRALPRGRVLELESAEAKRRRGVGDGIRVRW